MAAIPVSTKAAALARELRGTAYSSLALEEAEVDLDYHLRREAVGGGGGAGCGSGAASGAAAGCHFVTILGTPGGGYIGLRHQLQAKAIMRLGADTRHRHR